MTNLPAAERLADGCRKHVPVGDAARHRSRCRQDQDNGNGQAIHSLQAVGIGIDLESRKPGVDQQHIRLRRAAGRDPVQRCHGIAFLGDTDTVRRQMIENVPTQNGIVTDDDGVTPPELFGGG